MISKRNYLLTDLLLKGDHLVVELSLELVEALLQVLVDRVDRL